MTLETGNVAISSSSVNKTQEGIGVNPQPELNFNPDDNPLQKGRNRFFENYSEEEIGVLRSVLGKTTRAGRLPYGDSKAAWELLCEYNAAHGLPVRSQNAVKAKARELLKKDHNTRPEKQRTKLPVPTRKKPHKTTGGNMEKRRFVDYGQDELSFLKNEVVPYLGNKSVGTQNIEKICRSLNEHNRKLGLPIRTFNAVRTKMFILRRKMEKDATPVKGPEAPAPSSPIIDESLQARPLLALRSAMQGLEDGVRALIEENQALKKENAVLKSFKETMSAALRETETEP